MTEEEFRRELDALGRRYQSAITNMNSTTVTSTRMAYRQDARDAMADIATLERAYRAQDAKPKVTLEEAQAYRPDTVQVKDDTPPLLPEDIEWLRAHGWNGEFPSAPPTLVRKRRTVPPGTRAMWFSLAGVFSALAVLQFAIGATAVGCADLVFALAFGLALIRSR